jgi:hypothetical protein
LEASAVRQPYSIIGGALIRKESPVEKRIVDTRWNKLLGMEDHGGRVVELRPAIGRARGYEYLLGESGLPFPDPRTNNARNMSRQKSTFSDGRLPNHNHLTHIARRAGVIRAVTMFYFVGLGLSDEKDITVKGLEVVKRAERVYLEAYTAILMVNKEKLVRT